MSCHHSGGLSSSLVASFQGRPHRSRLQYSKLTGKYFKQLRTSVSADLFSLCVQERSQTLTGQPGDHTHWVKRVSETIIHSTMDEQSNLDLWL